MSFALRPFFGVTDTEAHFSFGVGAGQTAEIEVLQSGAPVAAKQAVGDADTGRATLHFDGLAPDGEYAYTGPALPANPTPPVPFRTFPAPGAPVDSLEFAFFSCHEPFKKHQEPATKPRRGAGGRMAHKKRKPGPRPLDPGRLDMWKHLGAAISSGDGPAFLLGLGDQVYADDAWRPGKSALKRMTPTAREQLYRDIYQDYLGIPEVQDVYSRCPSFLMWDDHEIRDGWGSYKRDATEVYRKQMLEAAAAVYGDFQLAHNPYAAHGAGLADPGYYAFQYGEIGFIVPDLRRHRSVKPP